MKLVLHVLSDSEGESVLWNPIQKKNPFVYIGKLIVEALQCPLNLYNAYSWSKTSHMEKNCFPTLVIRLV